MNKKEARKFVKNWLWNPGDSISKTNGMSWCEEYIEDVVSMIVDATTQPVNDVDVRKPCHIKGCNIWKEHPCRGCGYFN